MPKKCQKVYANEAAKIQVPQTPEPGPLHARLEISNQHEIDSNAILQKVDLTSNKCKQTNKQTNKTSTMFQAFDCFSRTGPSVSYLAFAFGYCALSIARLRRRESFSTIGAAEQVKQLLSLSDSYK